MAYQAVQEKPRVFDDLASFYVPAAPRRCRHLLPQPVLLSRPRTGCLGRPAGVCVHQDQDGRTRNGALEE